MKILKENSVVLNYELSLLDIVDKSGYGIIHPQIRLELAKEEEPEILKKAIDLVLVKFDNCSEISQGKVIVEMLKKGLHPGTLRELLTLAFFEPELHRHFRTVALGYTIYGDNKNFFPCLCREFNANRKISVYDSKKDFDCRYAFLASRNH